MKKNRSYPSVRPPNYIGIILAALSLPLPAAELAWNNSASTGVWNTTDANWSGSVWSNSTPDNATFDGTAPGSIALGLNLSAGTVAFAADSAYVLNGNARSLIINGDLQIRGTGGTVNPSGFTLQNGTFSASRIVTRSVGGGDWGRLNIGPTANVTATNGIDGSVGSPYTFSLNLNGGTLHTPFIKVADLRAAWGQSFTTLNGTEIIATASNPDFIQTYGDLGNNNSVNIGPGGAIINSNGFNIGIQRTLLDAGGGFLIKNGTGTLSLSAVNTYTGGTTVNGGRLVLPAYGGTCPINGTLTVNNGATVESTGDGTGLGFTAGASATTLNINGGTVTSASTIHIWNMTGGVNMTGGRLQSNGGVSSPAGTQLEWGNTKVTTNASPDSAEIGGRINLRSEAASLLEFNVADGGAANDLLVSAAITESFGKCGIVKSGAGTLKLTGSVNLTGVITVEQGTLDLSAATVSPSLRINAFNGSVVRLPASQVAELFIDGTKLTPGRWGAPGSVTAGLADFESSVFAGSGVSIVADNGPSARERWKTMKYGIFVHYVWDGQGFVTRNLDGSPVAGIDDLTNRFDETGFANDLESMGVEYVIFTAWHANFYPLFNTSAVQKHLGYSRNANEDMLGRMVSAVRAKGIRVLFYTHPGQQVAWGSAWHDLMDDLYAEMTDRYDIDGFYLDENDPSGNSQNNLDYPRMERAIRLHKPDAVMIQNFYGNLYTCDAPMGESGPATADLSQNISWSGSSAYAQVISQSWSAQVPKVPTATSTVTRSAEGIFRGAVLAAGTCTDGGGWAWAAGPFPGNGYWTNPNTNQTTFVGRWEGGVLEAMQGAWAHLQPVAESVKNTYPSNSWRPNPGTFITGLPNGIVATRSTNNSKEYIHVLNPPANNTLTLPPPADGKVFANARLLKTSAALTMTQNSRLLQLTLPAGTSWDTLDTVIVMDVSSPGDRGLTNDSTTAATYSGSWYYNSGRATTEYGRDVHETTQNGAYVEFAFDGTDVALIATCSDNRGDIDIFIDGVLAQTVNLQTVGDQFRRTVFNKTGLARGSHTLKAVKKSGSCFTVDAFRVTELIDNSDPSIAFETRTIFNNTQTTPGGIGYIEYDSNWQWQQRDYDEYQLDVHWAQANNSKFKIHFTGTGVMFEGNGLGEIDFFLDGVFLKHVNMNAGGNRTHVIGLDLNGLSLGNHILEGVKTGGVYVQVDAFHVYNTQNAQWSGQSSTNAIGGTVQSTPANGDIAMLTFDGTGVDVIAPKNSDGGTNSVSLDGSVVQYVNHYARFQQAQAVTCATSQVAFLSRGSHRLGIAKQRGNALAVDAVRVYKAFAPGALAWGPSGGGGAGTWDLNNTENWFDGCYPSKWWDCGGTDYAARFAGAAGNVTLASTILANRLEFVTTGYQLQGGSLEMCGLSPSIHTAAGVTATLTQSLNGSAGLTKSGSGTLKVTSVSSISGGTIVREGTLELSGATGGTGQIGGSISVQPGASLLISNGDGTGFGWNNPATNLVLDGGTVDAASGSHLGFGPAASVFLKQGGTINGTWQWNGGSALSFQSSGDATNRISGNLILRPDSGVDHAFDVKDGVSATDLLVSANLTHPVGFPASDLSKNGAGVMELSGNNSYRGATWVNEGTLVVSGSTGSIASVQVAANATLKVSGSLAASGNITNNGTIVFIGNPSFSAAGTITNNGTIINSSATLTLPANIINNGTIISLPSAPAGLSATPGNGQVSLSWSAASGAAGYTVKQSAFSGGPFTVQATTSSTTMTITGLINNTTYYFTVSATNAAGESANSSQVPAIPSSLPLPWSTIDVGNVGLAGSATYSSGAFTLQGAGTGVYAASDAFRFTYQIASGDCDIRFRIQSLTNPSVSAKSGVMVRESLAANARCAGVYVTPSSGIQFIWRSTTGTMVSISTSTGKTAPYWVRLTRSGNTFRAYYSSNGSSWTQFGNNLNISMPTNTYIGTAITSGTTSALCTGVLTNELVTP